LAQTLAQSSRLASNNTAGPLAVIAMFVHRLIAVLVSIACTCGAATAEDVKQCTHALAGMPSDRIADTDTEEDHTSFLQMRSSRKGPLEKTTENAEEGTPLWSQSITAPAQNVASEDACLNDPASFDTTLDVAVPRGQTKYWNFTVPPMSSSTEDYSYAMEHAFVVLPSRCVLRMGLQPNVGDAGRLINQWMGRIEELTTAPKATTSAERDVILAQCACGWAIFAHGSGGFTYDNPRYSIMLAAAGYGVLAPDSFASSTGLRYKAPLKNLSSRLREANTRQQNLSFWCENNVYDPTSGCTAAMENQTSSPSYPLCYNSDPQAILSHTEDWRAFYERVFRLRQLELDYVVAHLPEYIRQAPKVFLVGESEGGMAAARYSNPELEKLLASGGRIILQWSCESNYYTSCSEDAGVGGAKSTPILNMISAHDPYFSASPESVAFKVANDPRGYGQWPLTGNCFAKLLDQGFENATVIVLAHTIYHGLTVNTANVARALMKAFLAEPRNFQHMALEHFGRSGNELCTELQRSQGRTLLRCHELGSESSVHASEVSSCAYQRYELHKEYYEYGTYEMCASGI